MDNTFVSQGGVFDDGSGIVKYIYPDGRVQYRNTTGANQFDYVVPLWSTRPDAMQNGATRRKKFYQVQLNHSAKIGRHNISEMALFSRDEYATGIAHVRLPAKSPLRLIQPAAVDIIITHHTIGGAELKRR